MRETCIWRDADRLADLGLREVLDEAEVQDPALARRQRPHAVRHDVARLDELELGVLAAERVAERAGLAVRAAGGLVERRRPRRHRELERVEHRVEADAGVLGQLERRRAWPRRADSSSFARITSRTRSLSPRMTFIAQPWSR